MFLEFTINGKPYKVRPGDHPADITLNTFIRSYAGLFGTKVYCMEGGCGCCTVTLRSHHPVSDEYLSRGVNSCLVLLNVCHGCDIITIEGLGDRRVGYHPLQKRLAQLNGTQCGYCSPGFIMNMFSNLELSKGRMTAKDVEYSFDGNICRCTGYRPILDAMKSFATDAEFGFVDTEQDIEDLKLCPKIGKVLRCPIGSGVRANDGRIWYHPRKLEEIFDIFEKIQSDPYMLVAGNTAHGVFRRDPNIKTFINVNNVYELHTHNFGNNLELGANVTIAEMIEILRNVSPSGGFNHFSEMLKVLNLVAHVSVKNIGTIAGNLMMKHEHNEFISDIFMLLVTAGARVVIARTMNETASVSLPEFLRHDMRHWVITKIILPPLNLALFGVYKILPRTQNSHAFLNAGFCFTFSGTEIRSSKVVFGGVNPKFNESSATTIFLNGRNLFDLETFTEALNILDDELEPDWILPAPSPEYRKKLALGLFYKFVIKNAPKRYIEQFYRSGGYFLKRPLSSGNQYFDTRKEVWPVNKPVWKLEAMWQCSGEADYANDTPRLPGEVWAAFVPATRVLATVASIDASEALAMKGVIAFYSAKDIPGQNSYVTVGFIGIIENEELFCSDTVKYHSQPVGIVLAETFQIAQIAATKIRILYHHNVPERLLRSPVHNVIGNGHSILHENVEDLALENGSSNVKRIQGHLELGGQFHFSIESHTTVCIPRENGLLLYSSTQHMDHVQASITNALNIPNSRIEIEVRRLGGSFGCKISRCNHVAVGCALASWLSNRPVRFFQSIENNMRISGKRFSCISDYLVSTNDEGKMQSYTLNFYEDVGYSINESPLQIFALPAIPNCYSQSDSWKIKGNNVTTDAPSNSWCRAPGTLEAIAMTETVMEHISRVVNMDPVDVRFNNIPNDSEMKKLLPEFINETEYRQRRKDINAFNEENRWMKRGIAVSILRFPIEYMGQISAAVAIYHYDGTVLISHGGIEMGQGVNTKVAQVAAYTLGIPLDMIAVKASNTFQAANNIIAGASVASETVCFAVQKACIELLSRMEPVRNTLNRPTWLELVQKSHERNINLFSREIHKQGDLQPYFVWGLACSEMEIDILTGKWQITRVDIWEDTGESLSPLIDVGQIEGAFVQGLGYWLTERLVYDRQTGELKTFNTWEYKVPGALDIPIDFRVKLLQKRPNPYGFLRSKATGEIGICMSVSALFALRHALDSAGKDAGLDGWYELGAPTTIEDIVLIAGHSKNDFRFNV